MVLIDVVVHTPKLFNEGAQFVIVVVDNFLLHFLIKEFTMQH